MNWSPYKRKQTVDTDLVAQNAEAAGTALGLSGQALQDYVDAAVSAAELASGGGMPVVTNTEEMESLINDISGGNVPTTDVNELINNVADIGGLIDDPEVMNPNCLNYSYEPFVYQGGLTAETVEMHDADPFILLCALTGEELLTAQEEACNVLAEDDNGLWVAPTDDSPAYCLEQRDQEKLCPVTGCFDWITRQCGSQEVCDANAPSSAGLVIAIVALLLAAVVVGIVVYCLCCKSKDDDGYGKA